MSHMVTRKQEFHTFHIVGFHLKLYNDVVKVIFLGSLCVFITYQSLLVYLQVTTTCVAGVSDTIPDDITGL